MGNRYIIDWDKYASLARQTAAEGAVLLRNNNDALPLKKTETISIFGRIQFDYYKSGTGSGGMVNTRYVVGILDALKKEKDIRINEKLLKVYEAWVKDHPFEKGKGWGMEPWSQEEMILEDSVVREAAHDSDAAVVIIGRTAGEDQDNKNEKGSYLLTDAEEDMLSKVCEDFKRVIVVLNVGNIIDMKWADKYNIDAILYAWQGGMEGGNAVSDVLLGRVNPCGKLTDTIAYNIEDYPSTSSFGAEEENCYKEDVYVGYRYFETFAKDKVMYPFGFGLSYTKFDIEFVTYSRKDDKTVLSINVTNIGDVKGKQVVQVYVNPAQGLLGKPLRNLVGFAKTKELVPGETQSLEIEISDYSFASYDDSGATGFKSCYVLERGAYEFYVGENVRDAEAEFDIDIEDTVVVEKCNEAASPVKPFKRMKAQVLKDNSMSVLYDDVPLRSYSISERVKNDDTKEIEYTGDKGYTLEDVYDKKVSLEDFVSQLSDKDLCCIVRGEGMCSPKVTPGTAAAFGGVTESLQKFKIPVGCCADGPSGIRMDCGTYAFSMPNGTCIACTFNEELAKELYEMEGAELRKNHIDSLLGPGMNIHRNPLNGRNFEYFSEDPLLTGKMASALLRGMHEYDVTGTIKHFATNNQEFNRRKVEAVVSERALREIYLKGFEIAVKEGHAVSIMTTYGPLNGFWTASNYDLVTSILRNEWGYKGIVMTDWWAEMNEEGSREATIKNTAAMVRCQNDLYMVTQSAEDNSNEDNLEESLKNGTLRRCDLQRSAMNISRTLMKLAVMQRELHRISDEEKEAETEMKKDDGVDFNMKYHEVDEKLVLDGSKINTDQGSGEVIGIAVKNRGFYKVTLKVKCDASEIAQVPVTLFVNGTVMGTITINGTDGKWIEIEKDQFPFFSVNNYLKLYFAQSGMQIDTIIIEHQKDIKIPF